MKTVNLHAAKTQLSRLIADAENGEEIVLARAGKPVAKIVPITKALPPRKLGALKGKIVIRDDFDDLPLEIAEAFGIKH